MGTTANVTHSHGESAAGTHLQTTGRVLESFGGEKSGNNFRGCDIEVKVNEMPHLVCFVVPISDRPLAAVLMDGIEGGKQLIDLQR